MKAMIFAAGLGTRLKPLTDTLPKALVPVAGKPLLWHVIRRLKAAGYDDIVINVHHFADKIIDYIREQDDFGIRIRISDERGLLRETGGGVAYARPFLEDADHFLVHNVDILSDLDLPWLESSIRPDALATLVVSSRETSRYLLFDNDMRLVGWTNVKTGEVRSPYPGLDPESCSKFAFSGIHLMSSKVFPLMEEFGERFPVMDFYLKMAGTHPIYGAVPATLNLVDVGKLDTLDFVNGGDPVAVALRSL